MKGQILRNLLISLVILFATGGAHADDARIQQLRLGVNGAQTRAVLELSAPAGAKAQIYENPNRVEIDIPGGQWDAPGFTPGNNGLISSFEAKGSHVTLYLRRQAVIAAAIPIPANGEKPFRIAIDLKPATPAEFAMKLDETVVVTAPLIVQADLAPKNLAEQKLAIKKEEKKAVDVTPEKPVKKKLIVIDAGHGGIDPGATGRDGAHEKDITLAAARALRDALHETGRYRVVMTRDSDIYLKLNERVKVAQKNKADLFISLHADTVGSESNSTTHGASIYTISDKASDEVAARLAARENKADLIGPKASGKDAAVSNMLLDLLNQETMSRSKNLASNILDEFDEKNISMLERTHRSAGFAVLKGAEFPSVLIEMGFLSSALDEPLLRKADYRARMAAAIANGVDGFFSHDKLVSR